MKQKQLELQEEAQEKRLKVPTTVLEAVELAQELVRTFTVLTEAAPS